MNFGHLALWVTDLRDTKRFYEDGLGLSYDKSFTRNGVQNYFVSFENGTQLQFKFEPEEERRVESKGFAHLAIEVENVDNQFNNIINSTGCNVVREPTLISAADSYVAFVEDPNGYIIELVGTE